MNRRGALLLPVLLVAAVFTAGLWVFLQSPAGSETVTILHDLVGVFGVPGAAVLLLAGYGMYVKIKSGKAASPTDDVRIMQQIDRLIISLQEDSRAQRQALNEDMRNSAMMIRDQLEIVIKRELDAAERERRKRA